MELRDYISLFQRRLWLLLLVGVLAGGALFGVFSRRSSTYEAQVTVSVGTYLQSSDPNTEEIRSSMELAQTYAALVTTYEVLDGAIKETGVPLTPVQLRKKVKTTLLPKTSLLQITVQYKDADQAALLADAIANQLILQNAHNLTEAQQTQLNDAYAAIADIDQQMEEAKTWLAQIDQTLSEASEPFSADLQWMITERNTILDHMDRLTTNRAQYATVAATLEGRSSRLTVVEHARIPSQPVNPNTIMITVFGALGGAIIAAALVLLEDYLNVSIRSPRQIPPEVNLPILAKIPKARRRNGGMSASVLERYRMLRTNILLSPNSHQDGYKPLFIFTSPGAKEGKSTIAANLAVATTAANLQVLLIDANLRKPSLHKIFGLHQEPGLTSLLCAEAPGDTRLLEKVIQRTKVPGLQVITSGTPVDHAPELLGSENAAHWFHLLQQSSGADVILVDTPAALSVPDSLILASTIHAPTVVLFRAGKTNPQAALDIKEQFERLNLEVKGVVLNGMNGR